MRNLILLMASLLAACATAPTYYKDGATQEQFERDKYDCEQDGWQYAANMGAAGNPFIAGEQMRECMVRKHGYRVGPPK